MLSHPSVLIRMSNGFRSAPLLDLAGIFSWDISDPLSSAILLDIMRALPLSFDEVQKAKVSSWNKELVLVFTKARPSQIRWELFFDDKLSSLSTPIHDDLTGNPQHMANIRSHLYFFRRKYIKRRHTLYPRATHKNMSYGTRRDYEFREQVSLEDVPIFGQDDWQRYYARTGIMLDGGCEMRQKWYPSGAKPRTYFAQGGTTYSKSRFLQDFFTELANTFTPTHHDHRLNPSRLRGIHGTTGDFFIYDLSNFTSNMNEQKYFVEHLATFFEGVEVELLDEREGFVLSDLGEMLREYTETCVFGPLLSLERNPNFRGEHDLHPHGIASLLGIFGNLMTCTVAHYLIVSPTTDGVDSQNIAGDDGNKDEDPLNNFESRVAISLVGDYADDKCYKGSDPHAVCLKRPILQQYPSLTLLENIVPPSLITSVAYLLGRNPDSRYSFIGIEGMTVNKRVSTIGKDLYRFLTSAFNKGLHDLTEVYLVYEGFTNLVQKFLLSTIRPSLAPYFWPANPLHYDFKKDHPGLVLLTLRSEVLFHEIPLLRRIPCDEQSLVTPGDIQRCNSDGRLKLLERLGYLEKEEVSFFGDLSQSWAHWLWRLKIVRVRVPNVYDYSVVEQVPARFVH